MSGHQLQHGAEVSDIVGDEPELGTRFHGALELVESARRHDAPLVMPLLRPRIRKQDEDPAEAGIGECRQQEPRVVDQNADIGEVPALHLCQQFDHAVLEHLGAEKADVGMCGRLLRQMLSGAEADLEPKLGGRDREQPLRVDAAALRQLDM
jgi:hypothetical protein